MPATADTTFLKDVYEFELLGMKLMQSLKSWSDKIAFRNAVHEFIKRDGATIERMGRKASEFRFNIFFIGDTWRTEYANFLAKVSENNKGPCVHPLIGPISSVAVDIIEGSVTVATGRNLVELSVSVTEDRIDVSAAREEAPRLPTSTAEAQEAVATAQATADQNFPQSAPLVHTYAQAVFAYATSAEAATLDYSQVLQLPALLAQVGRTSDLCIAALLADPNVLVDADAYEVISLVEQGYAACLAGQEALLAQVALPVERIVTVSQPLISLCQGWYDGRDAALYADLIQQIQVVADPNWIQQGTALLIPPPTRGLP
jgi:prophage DNA circulation protein